MNKKYFDYIGFGLEWLEWIEDIIAQAGKRKIKRKKINSKYPKQLIILEEV